MEPLCEYLIEKGHQVSVAFNGRQGLDWLTKSVFDLVFLDVNIPEVSGIDLLKKIKRTSLSAKVVIMTGYPLMKQSLVMNLGADSYLEKPFHFSQVDAILDNPDKLP